jgi:hypothetical protein
MSPKTSNEYTETNAETKSIYPQPQQHWWTPLIGILSSDKLPEYSTFKLKEAGTFVPTIALVIQMMFMVFRAVLVTTPGVPLFYQLTNYFKVLCPVLNGIYIYLLKKHVHLNVLTSKGKLIFQFGNINILFQALSTSLMILSWVITHDDCHSDACLQNHPKQVFPLGLFIFPICGSFAMPMLYTCHDVSVCLISAFISFLLMVVAAVLLHMNFLDTFYIGLAGIVILISLVAYESNIYSTFKAYSQIESNVLAKVASENKEYLMKIQTEEMRHMIGTRNICIFITL